MFNSFNIPSSIKDISTYNINDLYNNKKTKNFFNSTYKYHKRRSNNLQKYKTLIDKNKNITSNEDKNNPINEDLNTHKDEKRQTKKEEANNLKTNMLQHLYNNMSLIIYKKFLWLVQIELGQIGFLHKNNYFYSKYSRLLKINFIII